MKFVLTLTGSVMLPSGIGLLPADLVVELASGFVSDSEGVAYLLCKFFRSARRAIAEMRLGTSHFTVFIGSTSNLIARINVYKGKKPQILTSSPNYNGLPAVQIVQQL